MKKQLRDFFEFFKNSKKILLSTSKIKGKNLAFLFLLISFMVKAQQPGFPFVDAGADLALDCETSCADLTANFFNTGETTSYEVISVDYDPPFPFTGGTSVSVDVDDRWSQIIPLPFDFCFFGETYSQFLIGSNGVITFDTNDNTPGGFCPWSFNASLPSPNLISASINGAYMDIDPSIAGSGTINYTFFGEAPERTMVVNFPSIPYFSCNSLTMTSQIVFYETTNIIDVYIENRSSGCTWNSGNALIGIQNVGGSQGIAAPGRNTGDWSATNEAWRFIPNGDSNVDFVWLDGDGVEIGNTAVLEVCPNETTIYTARATYTNCNGNIAVVEDTVTVTFEGGIEIVDLGDDESFCEGESFEIEPILVGNSANATFLWSTGATTPTITVSTSNTYSLVITDGQCTASGSITVNFETLPQVDLGPNILSCPGETQILKAVTNATDATFTWFENGVVIPNETSGSLTIVVPESIVNTSIIYSVETTLNNCSSTDSVTVGPYPNNPRCVISQGLSPEGSIGMNDNFDLEFLASRTGITNLQMFNRHGRQVYSLDNYVNQWVGQSDNGDILPTGTYYYIISLAGEDPVYGKQKTGWIYINRDNK